MSSFCLLSSEIQMGLSEGVLEMRQDGQVVGRRPIETVDRILVHGNSQITTQAMKACLSRGIEVVYFSGSGRYLGSAQPHDFKDTGRRLRQYALVSDGCLRLVWGRALLYGKLKSQELEYRRMADNGWHSRNVDFLLSLREYESRILHAESLPSLMGFEGISGRNYYAYFGECLPTGWTWRGREYHPPPDEVNAILSLTYAMATYHLESHCRQHGLDPTLSFLHRSGYGSGGLATDLVELVRSSICDHHVLRLLHSGKVRKSSFHRTDEGIRLTEDGFQSYLEEFRQRVEPDLEDFSGVLFPLVIAHLEHPSTPPEFCRLQPQR